LESAIIFMDSVKIAFSMVAPTTVEVGENGTLTLFKIDIFPLSIKSLFNKGARSHSPKEHETKWN
jgi:hypothetical protein